VGIAGTNLIILTKKKELSL